MIHRTCLAVLVSLIAWVAPAHADIILSIGSATIPAGQTTGWVDVTIHSSIPSGDSLNSFSNVTFQIVPSGSVSSPLRFVAAAPTQYEYNDSGYVFYGQSISAPDSAIFQPLSDPGINLNYSNDTIQGADSAISFFDDPPSFPDVPLTSAPLLLGRLQFAVDQLPSTSQTFGIRYLSGDFTLSDSTPVNLLAGGVPDGTVTFSGTANAPEPSTAVLLGLGILLLAVRGVWRRRQQAL
jgi:hypothetical protein